MSEESLDYLKLCSNYYSNWEDGCCMENCTFNYLDECPIHYVKGLLEEKDKTIAELEAQLANNIKPKFKPYDKFYTINDINHIVCRCCVHIVTYKDRIAYIDTYGAEYECDFGKETEQGLYTKEEAEQRLKEIKYE